MRKCLGSVCGKCLGSVSSLVQQLRHRRAARAAGDVQPRRCCPRRRPLLHLLLAAHYLSDLCEVVLCPDVAWEDDIGEPGSAALRPAPDEPTSCWRQRGRGARGGGGLWPARTSRQARPAARSRAPARPRQSESRPRQSCHAPPFSPSSASARRTARPSTATSLAVMPPLATRKAGKIDSDRT